MLRLVAVSQIAENLTATAVSDTSVSKDLKRYNEVNHGHGPALSIIPKTEFSLRS
jgi:hypothetical protein